MSNLWEAEEDEGYDLDPIEDNCRRCDQVRKLDGNGYCSRDCELGFTPMPYQRREKEAAYAASV